MAHREIRERSSSGRSNVECGVCAEPMALTIRVEENARVYLEAYCYECHIVIRLQEAVVPRYPVRLSEGDRLALVAEDRRVVVGIQEGEFVFYNESGEKEEGDRLAEAQGDGSWIVSHAPWRL